MEPKNRGWTIAVAVIAILAIGGALVWNLRDRLFGAAPPLDAGVILPAELPDSGAFEQKPLAEGDEKIRKLGLEGSKSPELAGWLSSPNIIQRIAAATKLIADGQSPAPVISFVEIEEQFVVTERGSQLFIDPKSYQRYDAVTAVFTSIDSTYAARAYADLRPYFETAYQEVAAPGERFDTVLKSAIDRVLRVQFPPEPIEVVPRGAIYLFKDPAIEALSPAEKHVLRLGPKNGRAFQESLKKFADAAGLTR